MESYDQSIFEKRSIIIVTFLRILSFTFAHVDINAGLCRSITAAYVLFKMDSLEGDELKKWVHVLT